MKSATIQEVKTELAALNKAELMSLCLRLAKYKKENKELLGFLLFNAYDLDNYIQEVQEEMLEMFKEVNSKHVFFAKKTLRKILRFANKHIKFATSKQAEIEILLHYCMQFKKQGSYVFKSTALANLYAAQLKKIDKAINTLHEDLQFEYYRSLEVLK